LRKGLTWRKVEEIAAPSWNIDRLCADEQAMGEADKHLRALSECRPLVDSHAATMEELEAEAFWIQGSLEVVLDGHAPRKKLALAPSGGG
jgi:hypothetical protein